MQGQKKHAVDVHDRQAPEFDARYEALAKDPYLSTFTYGRMKIEAMLDRELSSLPSGAKILDVGCGGGRTLERLAAMAAAGQVHGIDNADGSVLASKRWNAESIRQGRIQVALASVEAIPFPNCSFDLVTAVETQYFWPDLEQAMQEVKRVLKPGGRFIVIAEYYRKETREPIVGWVLALLRAHRLSLQEHRDLLTRAGFVDIRISEEVDRGWLCAIGCKPMQP
jgi:ubiquinone/menaquinone biosynthesis C-methylase UbiE